jgi:hypothetical protein
MSYADSLSKLREWASTSRAKEQVQLGSTRSKGLAKKYAPDLGFMKRVALSGSKTGPTEGLGNSMYLSLLEERVDVSEAVRASDGDVSANYTPTKGYGKGYDPKGPTQEGVVNIIRKEAKLRGIPFDLAYRTAKSEGLGVYESQVPRGGGKEQSFGPYQLFMDGGLGNEFLKDTGIHPGKDRSSKSLQKQVQYSLDHVATSGWGAWYGAKKVGITGRMGLKNAKPIYNWK